MVTSLLSVEDRAVVEEMEGLAWQAIKQTDPIWAQQHLVEFDAIELGPDAPIADAILRRKRDIHFDRLQQAGKVSDFWLMQNQARANLGLPPTFDLFADIRPRG
jgi:hypothetical protein